jgi:hypothetical protein
MLPARCGLIAVKKAATDAWIFDTAGAAILPAASARRRDQQVGLVIGIKF